jgi:hypothetical protein
MISMRNYYYSLIVLLLLNPRKIFQSQLQARRHKLLRQTRYLVEARKTQKEVWGGPKRDQKETQ